MTPLQPIRDPGVRMRWARTTRQALLWLVLGGGVLAAHAQPATVPQPSDDEATWALQWENDLFARGRTDRHYTNGIRILRLRTGQTLAQAQASAGGWVQAYGSRTGGWLCRVGDCVPGQAQVAVDTYGAQNMYTPRNLRRAVPSLDDRPYAGWLYLGNRTRLMDLPDAQGEASRLQVLDLSLGVVGPSAGGGAVQRGWHRLVGAVAPQGWGHQLRDEPAVQLVYTQVRRLPLGPLVDVLPHWRLSAGNVLVSAAAGGQMRIGRDLDGFGHLEPMQSAIATAGTPAQSARRGSPLYAFAGFEARAVARNIFIDGNTFRDSPATRFITRQPLVADASLGVSMRIGSQWRISYAHIWRSREFSQDRPQLPGERLAAVQRYGVIQLQREQ